MANLIKKEIIVSLRAVGGMLLLLLLMQFVVIFYMNKGVYETITDQAILNSVFVSTIMLSSLMLIPLIAVLSINAVMAEEKKERILQVLFANGVSVKQIWRSRIFATSVISYVVNFLGLIISFIYIRVAYHMWIGIGLKDFFDMFLLLPSVAIAVVNIMCLLMWSSKTAQLFVGFIPSISYIGFMYLGTVQFDFFGKLNNPIVECIILGIVVLVIAGCEVIAKKISKEYLISVLS